MHFWIYGQLQFLSGAVIPISRVRVRSLQFACQVELHVQFACQVELHAPAEENNPTNIGLLKVKRNQVKGTGHRKIILLNRKKTLYFISEHICAAHA